MSRLAIILLALPCVSLPAATYYVDGAQGRDTNNGLSPSAAFQTITHALSQVADGTGNTITIRGGKYQELVMVNKSGGGAEAKLVIQAQPGEEVVIDGADTLPAGDQAKMGWAPLVAVSGSWVEMRGITVTRSRGTGVQVGDKGAARVSHVRLYDIDSNWHFESGFRVKNAAEVTIENCKSWRTNQRNSPALRDKWGPPAKFAWGSSLTIVDSLNCTVRGCSIFETYGEGLSDLRSDGSLFEDNVTYDHHSVCLYLDNSTNSIVRRNLIFMSDNTEFWRYKNPLRPSPGFVTNSERYYGGAPNPGANQQIYNNFVYNAGILFGMWSQVKSTPYTNVTIAHNTFVSTRTGPAQYVGVNIASNDARRSGVVFQNNSISLAAGTIINGPTDGINFSHNHWSTSPGDNFASPDDVIGDASLTLGAGDKPDAEWLKLKAGSPLIDQGTPVSGITTDFFNHPRNAPDIGAHEFGVTWHESPDS